MQRPRESDPLPWPRASPWPGKTGDKPVKARNVAIRSDSVRTKQMVPVRKAVGLAVEGQRCVKR